MSSSRTLFSLRNLLLADAATCVAMGALLALAAGGLAELMRIPSALLFYAGISLFPIAVFMAIVGLRPAVPPAGAWLVVAGNLLWVAGSLLLLLAGWIAPNALGWAFLLAQALAVTVLAVAEYVALRNVGMVPQSG